MLSFYSHRAGVLSVLSVPDKGPLLEKSTVADAILLWDSKEFERECAAKGLCVTALRSYAEWDSEEQKKALEGLTPVVVVKVGDAPRRRSADDAEAGKEKQKEKQTRPLDGMRVLDLSRVLAGPIAGKSLAGSCSFYTNLSFTHYSTMGSTWCRRPAPYFSFSSVPTFP